MTRSPWIKPGFWNTLEHGITNAADALSAIVLVWILSTGTFSRLALAQAFVSACLLFFISPETILTRDLLRWKQQGAGSLLAMLSALRYFGWIKWMASIGISAVVSAVGYGTGPEAWTRFWALVWAFSLVLAPQVGGADREFLRRELRLKELNLITLYRKLSFTTGTVVVAFVWPERLDLLALVACVVLITSAAMTQWQARKWIFHELGGSREEARSVSAREVLKLSFNSYSIWVHIAASLSNWVQSMDLFFLGVFLGAGHEAGLYAIVLKLANFSAPLPIALANGVSLWVSRREAGDPELEREKLRRFSFWFIAAVGLQALTIWLLSPWAFRFLSHGRWSAIEQTSMTHWLAWILAGTAMASSTQLARMWLQLRADMRDICLRLHLPWAVSSAVMYGLAAWGWGIPGAAMANVLSSAVLIVLASLAYRLPSHRRTAEAESGG
jgi:hypothetical protein